MAVPFPPAVKLNNRGSGPLSVMVGSGNPIVVTLMLVVLPTFVVATGADVMAGDWSTDSTKVCEADPSALEAFSVIRYVPPLPPAGVPPIVAVPFALAVKRTPPGRVPVSVMEGTGLPEVVTVKVNGAPTVAVSVDPEVNCGLALPPVTLCVTEAVDPVKFGSLP